ncbi:MAG: ABC transporter substrate-binding protein [Candidatus Asgardarchaeia archaeon]
MSGVLKKTSVVVVLFIVLFVSGVGVGYFAGVSTTSGAQGQANSGLSGDVKVVFLAPLTGVLSTYGENSKQAALLAAQEVNDWLAARGESWRLDLIVDDTATDPTTALSKLQSWHGAGVQLFVGPMSSGEVSELKSYADSNHLLVISPSSTSPALSLPGDYIFRYCPDDFIQGPAIARLMWEAGVRHAVVTWRGDTWGDGLENATKNAFIKLGGQVHEAVRYDPNLTDFPTQASSLADAVQSLINDGVPKSEIGVLAISFEEIVPYMEDAASYDVLKEVNWFGSDGTALLSSLLENDVAGSFAAAVNFTSTIFAPGVSPKFEHVRDYINKTLGRTPDSYAYNTYDIVWTLALALEAVDQYNATAVKEVLPSIVENYFGASGWFKLNENGDRAFADYNLWAVQSVSGEVQWVFIGVWRGATDQIEWKQNIFG